MYGCTDRAKATAYLALVRPCLEYCNVVWTLYTAQHRAAKWIKSSLTFQWTKSSDECLRELEWPSLEQRRMLVLQYYTLF